MSPLGVTDSMQAALREAQQAVDALAGELGRLGERHACDHDVLHMSRTLQLRLDEASAALAAHGEGLHASEHGEGGLLAGVRRKVADVIGSAPASGVLLLADLRRFLAQAADASIACTVLAQGAQAARQTELLQAVRGADDTVQRCHRWALTRLRETAAQVLTGP